MKFSYSYKYKDHIAEGEVKAENSDEAKAAVRDIVNEQHEDVQAKDLSIRVAQIVKVATK